MQSGKHFLWVEKYRPKKIADCILPEDIKSTFQGYVDDGRVPTLILVGGAGCGKTTVARCLANELSADFMVVNASMDTGIDNIRTKVLNFASSVSFGGGMKITLLDEADYLSHNSQAACRNFQEQFSDNHSIIFTANFKSKLIEPLLSRSQVIDFKFRTADIPKLSSQFFKRVQFILDEQHIEYDKKVVAEVVKHYFPDFRRCINELQKHAIGGSIGPEVLTEFSNTTFDELVVHLKNKKFNEIRKWVANHSDIEPNELFNTFYTYASDKFDQKSIPAIVLMLNEAQYKSGLVANQEINTLAFLTSIMTSGIVFK